LISQLQILENNYQAQKKKKKKSCDGLLTIKTTCAKLLYFLLIMTVYVFVLGSYFLKSAVEKSNRLLCLLIRISPITTVLSNKFT
jgi:hypothetical protein